MSVDTVLGHELELWYENTQSLYNMSMSWKRNFDSKKKVGKYNTQLAIKGIRDNFVPKVIADYNKNSAPLPRVDRETKEWIAKRWVDSYENGEME